ncbi:MAG: hypothetical protein M9930_04355 [Anaerolineae bacterium]|nr:hypothetical protein [Anaerolineae bacterium]
MGRAKIGLIVVALWLLVACVQESGVDSAESTPTSMPVPTEPLAAPIIVTEPAPATATPVVAVPTDTPALPTPTPTPSLFETVEIGRTIGGAPIEAERIGHGSFRVVIAATDQPPVQALLDHFRAMPGAVPENVTLWIVHNSDPDGIGGVFTNADSSFDGCFDNSGSERFPFNTVEARALRDVTQSASAVILLDSAENNRILLDTCRQSAPAQQLGTLASGMLNRPLQPLRNTPGHFVDYLSSEGVAAIAIEGGCGRCLAAGAGRTGDGGCGRDCSGRHAAARCCDNLAGRRQHGQLALCRRQFHPSAGAASRRRYGIFARRRAHPANRSACACGADCFDRNGRGDRRLAGAGVDRSGSG